MREVHFRYQEHPELGPGVANIFMDAVLASGATAHLAFCPTAGVVVERAKVHLAGHSLFLHVPMWNAFDSPGRLHHLDARHRGIGPGGGSDGATAWELGGFYAEYEAFLGDIAAGRTPGPSLAARPASRWWWPNTFANEGANTRHEIPHAGSSSAASPRCPDRCRSRLGPRARRARAPPRRLAHRGPGRRAAPCAGPR